MKKGLKLLLGCFILIGVVGCVGNTEYKMEEVIVKLGKEYVVEQGDSFTTITKDESKFKVTMGSGDNALGETFTKRLTTYKNLYEDITNIDIAEKQGFLVYMPEENAMLAEFPISETRHFRVVVQSDDAKANIKEIYESNEVQEILQNLKVK